MYNTRNAYNEKQASDGNWCYRETGTIRGKKPAKKRLFRPAGFMEEFANPKSIRFITGLLNLYLPKNKVFQLISIQDIGKFVAIFFEDPEKYLGKELEIAGDNLTLNKVFEKIENITQKKLSPAKIPVFIKYLLPRSMKQMFTFYAEDGWHADINLLKQINPELLTFESWLKQLKVQTMNTELLIYAGSTMPFLWGVAHLFPTKSVVQGFGEISTDNKNIITMEWITEGVALIFIGTIVATVTVIEPRTTVSSFIYLASSGCLVVLAFVSLFTGFKISFLPFKLCPLIFASSAILISLGWGFL